MQDYKSLAQYLTRDHSSSRQQLEKPAIVGQTSLSPVEEYYRLSEDEETVLIKVFATSLKLITERGFEQMDGKAKDKKKAAVCILQYLYRVKAIKTLNIIITHPCLFSFN